MLAGSPAWFLVGRWHGIDSTAAMNLAAMLLALPQHKALARKVQGIFEGFSESLPKLCASRGQGEKDFVLRASVKD